MATYLELAKSLYPNMPDSLLNMFANKWAETDNPKVAIAEVRASTEYETLFPGNKRAD